MILKNQQNTSYEKLTSMQKVKREFIHSIQL